MARALVVPGADARVETALEGLRGVGVEPAAEHSRLGLELAPALCDQLAELVELGAPVAVVIVCAV